MLALQPVHCFAHFAQMLGIWPEHSFAQLLVLLEIWPYSQNLHLLIVVVCHTHFSYAPLECWPYSQNFPFSDHMVSWNLQASKILPSILPLSLQNLYPP
jgi:hypothetical protein